MERLPVQDEGSIIWARTDTNMSPIMPRSSASTHAPQLSKVIQLFIAVAQKDRDGYEPHERQATVQLSQQWAPGFDRSTIEAMVDTAYVAARSGFGKRTEDIAAELRAKLSAELRTRLIRDLGLIASADGHLTLDEARLIGSLRSALGHPRRPKRTYDS